MRYVTAIERMAEVRGIEQGVEQCLEQGIVQKGRQAVIQALTLRFSSVPAEIHEKINNTKDVEILDMLFQQSILTQSTEDFTRTLNRIK